MDPGVKPLPSAMSLFLEQIVLDTSDSPPGVALRANLAQALGSGHLTLQLGSVSYVTVVLISDSGFGHSRLVKENLIDFFVPFLPLEYHHVRLCARDAFLSQQVLYTEEALDEIAKMMVYVPKEEQFFSSQGCKSVSQRINYFLP